MKKLSVVILYLSSAFSSSSQLLTFDFEGLGGDEVSASSNYNAPGVSPSTITRGAGLTAQFGPDRFNSKTFTESTSVDLTDYLQFTVTPYLSSVTIGSITIQGVRSSQGPTTFVMRTNIDGYSADATNIVTITSTSLTTRTFTFTAPITSSTPVTIRLYGYTGGASQTGTYGPGGGAGNDIIVNGLAALPIKFGDVLAVKKAGAIEVRFTNFTESDVTNYTIERSGDGNRFGSLAHFLPKRNDGSKAEYIFLDKQPLNGINYYRIRSLEITGRITYSVIINTSIGFPREGITIYSNPIRNNVLTYSVADLPAGNYKIMVKNSLAQTVYDESIIHNGGSYRQSVNLPGLKNGSYYLGLLGSAQLRKQFMVE